MSTKYKATRANKAYFVTITTVNWADVFTRLEQRMVLVNALNYCTDNKGLVIYGYCIMPSHLHLLCRANNEEDILADILRDFKKFTSKKIISTIINEKESRRDWLLEMFEKSCEHLKREQNYKVWQSGYHAVLVESEKFVYQKLNYIHNNPVVDKIVLNSWEYVFSSAKNYNDEEGLVKVFCLPKQMKTVK